MENLREARKEAGYTQKQLAELLGISQQSYSDYENKRTFPDESTLLKLAGVLNVSLDYLLGRSDELGAVVVPGAPQLSSEDKDILERYHSLRPDLKEAFWITLNALSGTPADSSKKKA